MEHIQKKLRAKGHRITRQHERIVEALNYTPQSVSEIITRLSRVHTRVNKTTIYRTLERLVSLDVVSKMQLGDSTLYELQSASHHHHVTCGNCKTVKDITVPEELLVQQIQKQTNFQIQNHTLEFFGLCSNCK